MRDRKETKDRVKAVLILVGMTITEDLIEEKKLKKKLVRVK